MKRIAILACVLALGGLLAGPPLFAADYSRMTNEEIAALRERRQNAPAGEQLALDEEWQRRLQAMSPGERRRYEGSPPRVRGQEESRLQEETTARERRLRAIGPGSPRRFGQEETKRQLPQTGPRRFNLTPDYNGRSRSPFAVGPSDRERGRR